MEKLVRGNKFVASVERIMFMVMVCISSFGTAWVVTSCLHSGTWYPAVRFFAIMAATTAIFTFFEYRKKVERYVVVGMPWTLCLIWTGNNLLQFQSVQLQVLGLVFEFTLAHTYDEYDAYEHYDSAWGEVEWHDQALAPELALATHNMFWIHQLFNWNKRSHGTNRVYGVMVRWIRPAPTR